MKTRYYVLSALFLLSTITYIDRVCMNVVSKYVKADLQLNNQQFGYILSAFSLAYALFEISTGILGDKIGSRRVLTRVVIWYFWFRDLELSDIVEHRCDRFYTDFSIFYLQINKNQCKIYRICVICVPRCRSILRGPNFRFY